MIDQEIMFLPVDLPKLSLNRSKVLNYFDSRKQRHQDWLWVNFKKYNQPIDKDLIDLFPNLEKVLRMLPYKNFDTNLHIDFREQVLTNKPHQDPIARSMVDEKLGPTSYKNLVMRDKLESFYVLPYSSNSDVVQYDKRPITELNPIYPALPEDTDWFVINNHKGFHGSVLWPSNYRKITMFFAGELDELKHVELIERSFQKYKSYVVFN